MLLLTSVLRGAVVKAGVFLKHISAGSLQYRGLLCGWYGLYRPTLGEKAVKLHLVYWPESRI